MEKYEIVIESSADLNKELRELYHIHSEYIQNIVYLPDGKEFLSDLDWNNYTPDQFFNLVKKNAGKIRTAFGSFAEFKRVVEPILKEGKDVIIPTISSAISGTYQGYKNYIDVLMDDYPDRKVVLIDSLKYSSAVGLLAIYLAKNRDEGMSLEDNIKWAEENKNRLHEIGPMDDLRFLAKNGRISAPKAFFGQLAGVQPLADFTLDGKSQPLGTVKGDANVYLAIKKYLLETAENLDDQVVIICHSQREEKAKKLEEIVMKVAHPKAVHITTVCQSCGPNIGPGLACIFYLGKPLTADRSVENAAFSKATAK